MSADEYGGYRGARGAVGTATAGVFGQVMGFVAFTVAFFTLGACVGRHLTSGASIVCFILGFLCIIGLNFARQAAGAMSITLLFAGGLLLGLGLGGGLYQYAQAEPGSLWHAASATALFIAGLGSVGYAIRTDLSAYYRFLFFALLALIVFGLVAVFVSIPGGDVIYCVLGLVIFGGYTVLDFNRLRRAGIGDSVRIASSIFLDVLNVFLFFLQLFGNRE